jgi:hypothetical protein
MSMNKLFAQLYVALLASLIPAQGAHRRPKSSMIGKEQLQND